jgi:hypothetical protein
VWRVPSGFRAAVTVHVVRVPHVVHLEAERVLQVVARLLIA